MASGAPSAAHIGMRPIRAVPSQEASGLKTCAAPQPAAVVGEEGGLCRLVGCHCPEGYRLRLAWHLAGVGWRLETCYVRQSVRAGLVRGTQSPEIARRLAGQVAGDACQIGMLGRQAL